MNPCHKCGEPLINFNRGGELVFDCHYDPKDCRALNLASERDAALSQVCVLTEALGTILSECPWLNSKFGPLLHDSTAATAQEYKEAQERRCGKIMEL